MLLLETDLSPHQDYRDIVWNRFFTTSVEWSKFEVEPKDWGSGFQSGNTFKNCGLL